MIFLDTETCGLHGLPVLIQYAVDDGEVQLSDVWQHPVRETLELIEWMVQDVVCGFNLTFDWFHIQKLYSVFSLVKDKSEWPEDIIDEIAALEPIARDCLCVKPKGAIDLMLHARKGPYQSTMERGNVKIRKVPTALAWRLAEELNKRIPLNDLYFARKKDPSRRFEVRDRKNDLDNIDPAFKDVVLTFAPSSALKALAADALGADVTHYSDIAIPDNYLPVERGYAPFALAFSKPPFWVVDNTIEDDELEVKGKGMTWPGVIRFHIDHWMRSERAREYAKDDVVYLQQLYNYFGCPEPNDVDSTLACAVASMRWRGYKVDVPRMKEIVKTLSIESQQAPRSAEAAYKYISQYLSPIEAAAMDSTQKSVLEQMSNWTIPVEATDENGETTTIEKPHPAAKAATEVLSARKAKYNFDILNKIIRAGRFHPSLSIIGALSGRMGGGGGDLNAHGITHREDIRECFSFAWPGESLDGGDYDSFEITIAIAVYNDEGLTAEVKSGKKIHGIFGTFLFPGHTYEQILATDNTENDLYKKSKSAVFSQLFGGDAGTINRRLGVPIEQAEKGEKEFARRYPGVGKARQRVIDMFSSMRQSGGIGTKIEWADPCDYMETLFGFRRYFTLENQICKELYNLAERPPKEWQSIQLRVVRSDRVQTASGATQSALFGAAFGIQGSNVRAAANHEIQGTGAFATKTVQCRVWNLQPAGIHPWVVSPFQIHDELIVSTAEGWSDKVRDVVNATTEELRAVVPLLSVKWKCGMKSWAEN